MSLRITDNVDKSVHVLQHTAKSSSTTTLSDVEQTTCSVDASQASDILASDAQGNAHSVELLAEELQASASEDSVASEKKRKFKFETRKEPFIEKTDVEQELLKPSTSESMVFKTQTKKRRFRFGKRKEEGCKGEVGIKNVETMTLQMSNSEQDECTKQHTLVTFDDVPIFRQKSNRESDIVKIQNTLKCNTNTATLFYGLITKEQDICDKMKDLSTIKSILIRLRIIAFTTLGFVTVCAAVIIGFIIHLYGKV